MLLWVCLVVCGRLMRGAAVPYSSMPRVRSCEYQPTFIMVFVLVS